MKFTTFLLLAITTFASAAAPRYPLKSARTLHTDDQITLARANIAKYPSARAVADRIIKHADEWVAWNEQDVRALLTSSEVPRAFAVSASGCPLCGDKLKESNGDYSWIIDPKLPDKIKCPVDGAIFPDKDHPDGGWGWTNPDTKEKFWFIAYYNHWMWHKYLVPACLDLSHAYLLTGDKKYANQAAVMLHRIAEVYPAMDHAKQSRYGEMMRRRGADYPGKVVNAIWECFLAQSLAEAYDAVWETLDEKSRALIEADFLENAIDAYFTAKIRGNFGMHQHTLCYLALVRQHGENEKWFDMLMNDNSSSYPTLGLNYALYNLLSNDGVPMEGAPGYNNIWVSAITDYGDLLQRAGRDVFSNTRLRRMYDAVIDQINVGKFTPDIGDTGNIWGGLVGAQPETFQTAYRRNNDPRYAAFLSKMNALGENQFKTFDSLFFALAPSPGTPGEGRGEGLPPAKPRLLPGFGLAVLNNPADTISMSVYYGQHHGHGHYDRLNFELFASGVKIMPDNGYPDAMNVFVPGIYTWSKNTISHNTAVIGEKRQQGVAPGAVQLFADSPFARAVDIDAPETYPGVQTYRRAMIMVDVSDTQSYFVDIFTAIGNGHVDYSLHGPPGEFEMIGGKWSDPAKGTLAGEDVPLGKIYDDPALGAPEFKGPYSTYEGSGFQHLFNVRARLQGPWIAQWKHEKDPSAMLRIRILGNPTQSNLLCDARVSPEKYPQILKYLIARDKGSATRHRFISVIEPFKDKPFIKDVKEIRIEDADAASVEVTREDGQTEVIVYNPRGQLATYPARHIRTRSHVAVSTYDDQKNVTRWFRALAAPPATATVTEIYPMQSAVKVSGKDAFALEPNAPGIGLPVPGPLTTQAAAAAKAMEVPVLGQQGDHLWIDPQSLKGRVVHFVNGDRNVAHTVTSVRREDDGYVLTLAEDILVGLAKIDAVESRQLPTSTALPLAPTYRNIVLADEIFRFQHPVKDVDGGRINLASPLPDKHPLKANDRVWLMNVGVGDAVYIPRITWSVEDARNQ